MKHTDKTLVSKGLKYMGMSLPLAFLGPSVLYSAFNNQENPFYIPVLIFGIIACAGSIFFMFKGINTLVKSLFDQ
ncbi:MAG: DUF6095 family protein [Gillisia sp.]|nr:DUF6095 family protein [Gillisia sp.]